MSSMLRLDVVEEIIQDIELEQRGAVLYYTIDPFDLVTFCFPVPPQEQTMRNLDDIADEQAALYEVVFARNPRPFILEEYADEIDSIFHYLRTHIQEAFSKTGTIEALIRKVQAQRTDLA